MKDEVDWPAIIGCIYAAENEFAVQDNDHQYYQKLAESLELFVESFGGNMNEQNGNGQQSQMREFQIPDFICMLVGQLQVQNAALAAQVQSLEAILKEIPNAISEGAVQN